MELSPHLQEVIKEQEFSLVKFAAGSRNLEK